MSGVGHPYCLDNITLMQYSTNEHTCIQLLGPIHAMSNTVPYTKAEMHILYVNCSV